MIDKLVSRTREAVRQLEEINREEVYLDWDPSEYPLLDQMLKLVDLFAELWHVALEFHEK